MILRATFFLLAFAVLHPGWAETQTVNSLPGLKDLHTFSVARWNPWAVRVPPRLIPEPIREPFPPFQLPLWRGGERRQLASYRGRVLLLDFWSRTCPACIPTHEALVRNAPDWARLGVQVVTVLVGEAPEGLEAFFEAHGGQPPFPVLLDPEGRVLAATGRAILPRLDVLDIYGRRAIDRLTGYPQFGDLTPLLATLASARDRPEAP